MTLPVKALLTAFLLAIPLPSPALPGDSGSAPRVIVVGDDDDDTVEIEAPRAPLPPRVRMRAFASGSYLGLELIDITPDLRAHYGAPRDSGVLVGEVEKDSPASAAGVEVGDVVTAVDGEHVSSSWDLSRTVGQRAPGDSVKIEVRRNGASRTLTAKVAERHGDDIVLHGMGRDIAREVRRSMRNQNWNYDVDTERVGVLASGEVRKLRERLERLEKRLKELEEKKTR